MYTFVCTFVYCRTMGRGSHGAWSMPSDKRRIVGVVNITHIQELSLVALRIDLTTGAATILNGTIDTVANTITVSINTQGLPAGTKTLEQIGGAKTGDDLVFVVAGEETSSVPLSPWFVVMAIMAVFAWRDRLRNRRMARAEAS